MALTIVPVLAYWFLRQREAKVKLTRAEKKEIRRSRKGMLSEWRSEKKAAKKASKKQDILTAAVTMSRAPRRPLPVPPPPRRSPTTVLPMRKQARSMSLLACILR